MSSRVDGAVEPGVATPGGIAGSLGIATAVMLFVGLPVLMTIANKSAPLSLAIGAVLANAAALFCAPAAVLLGRYRAVARTGTASILAATAVLAVASLTWTIDVGATRRGLVEAAPELLFGSALAAAWPLVVKVRHFELLKVGLVLAATLILAEALTGLPMHRLFGARAEHADLKRSAVPIVLMLWPCLDYCLGRGERAWAVALTLAALAAGAVAHSSASVVAVTLSALVYLAARVAPRASLSACAAGALLLLMLAPWTGTIVSQVLSPESRALLAEQHADIRIGLWTNFERHIGDRPLLGHGFDASRKVANEPDAEHDSDVDMEWSVHPHNILLQLWVELGLVGASGFAAVIAFCATRLRRLSGPQRASRLGFIAANAAVALVGLNAWIPWWLAVLALGLVSFAVLKADDTPLAHPPTSPPA